MSAVGPRVFRGEQAIAALPADARGFAYGDGVFETMRGHGGDVPWWPAHWWRMEHGAARLGLALPAESAAHAAVRDALAGGDGVVRLVLSRGEGARGYASTAGAAPLWVVSLHPLPAAPGPLALRWCETRLALQPLLAGIKHCNRLEQVLARAECADGHDEGLMLDTEGQVVCATAANVFVLRDGEWLTPPVDRCGVRGVCREWVVEALAAREQRLRPADVESADAVFLCNAVRGILEVARLGEHTWPLHARVARLRARLAAANPAFEPSAPDHPESP